MINTAVSVKLLVLFDAVYRLGSITRAAEELGMSQPGVSVGIGKLRRHFRDPLFVRAPAGMVPTVRAQTIAPTVASALAQLEEALDNRGDFFPGSSKRTFRICMTDATQLILLPGLLQRMQQEAPSASVEVLRFSPDTLRAMANGEIDLVIGLLPNLERGLREQTLLQRRFVCVVSKNHPRIKKTITIKQFDAEPHIAIQASGTGLGLAEKLLSRRSVERRVRLRVPDFVGMEALIASSDMIASMPEQVGQRLAAGGLVKVLEHPVRIPGYPVKQYWHERFHRDPGGLWLRKSMRELLLEKVRP